MIMGKELLGQRNFELQSMNNDLESQVVRPKRKQSYIRRSFTNSSRKSKHQHDESDHNDTTSNISRSDTTRTTGSSWAGTPGVLLRWATRSSQSTLTGNQVPDPRPEQTAFIDAVTGPEACSEELEAACKWYTSFQRSRIKSAWTPLFRSTLVGVCEDCSPCDDCMEKAFRILRTVVSVFSEKNLSLVTIVDALYNNSLLVREDEDEDQDQDLDGETDHDRLSANQLSFCIFGWLSLLYTPDPKPSKGQLEIVESENNEDSTPCRRYRSKILTTYRVGVLERNDQPLHNLLRCFGKILPDFNTLKDSSSVCDLGSQAAGLREYFIDISLVCFNTLHRFAGIKIEWVDSLSLHLVFDSRTKTLKVFRFPSLAFIMYANRSQPLMSRIFQDSRPSYLRTDSAADESEYFKEVILTYRLLFSQTKGSRKDFKTESKKWDLGAKGDPDPMLERLCAYDCDSDEAAEIYFAIDADDKSNHYNPNEFSYFEKRLLALQDYVRGHSPHSLRALWYDRRNLSWWWTFWAVIFFGAPTVILTLVQTILAALQLAQS